MEQVVLAIENGLIFGVVGFGVGLVAGGCLSYWGNGGEAGTKIQEKEFFKDTLKIATGVAVMGFLTGFLGMAYR